MTCSQIWLVPLVDDGHVATLQKNLNLNLKII
jgi:hypothetical protein